MQYLLFSRVRVPGKDDEGKENYLYQPSMVDRLEVAVTRHKLTARQVDNNRKLTCTLEHLASHLCRVYTYSVSDS